MSNHYVSVRDVMSERPRSIDGLASVAQAVEIMGAENISSLIIEKRHEGDEYGMLVIHDIAEKVIGQGRALDRVSIYEIMSKPAITVDSEMDIKYAVRLLTRFGLSRALVVEKDELIGIVTLRDMVLRFAATEGVGQPPAGD